MQSHLFNSALFSRFLRLVLVWLLAVWILKFNFNGPLGFICLRGPGEEGVDFGILEICLLGYLTSIFHI